MFKRQLAGAYLLCFFGSMYTMQDATQPQPAVIADINSVITQNIDKKKDVLCSELKCGTFMLWLRLQWAFGQPIYSEASARGTFFDFLDAIPVEKQYPVVRWQHQQLPRIMAAWILNQSCKTKHIMDRIERHIEKQDCSEASKKVYKAMIKTTFDLGTLAKTSDPNEKILRILGNYRTQGRPTYLIGHCTPESYELIAKNGKDFLSPFTGILFSHQAPDVTLHTVFDRSWWLEHLKLRSDQPHIFIDDGSLEPDQEPISPQAESVVGLFGSERTVSPIRI